MKKISKILVISLVVMMTFSGLLWAEQSERNGAVGGTFVGLVEREIGEQGYMGIVIKPHDRDEHVTVLVPRQREELSQAARRLREGQQVDVSFVTEAGQKWIRSMETERREVVEERPESRRKMDIRREVFRYEDGPEGSRIRRPERREPRRPERRETRGPEYPEQIQELKRILSSNLDRMAGEFQELRMHIREMERELRILRQENERLRRELREREPSEREREREVRVRIQRERESREPEERDRRREREEGRAPRERPRSEREVAIHELEVMRMALTALREAERGDAVELLTLAIHAREMMLEGRRDEEEQRVRERAPDRRQLAEILSIASKLWREYGNVDKSIVVGELAEQLSGPRDRQVREREEVNIRRRPAERREIDIPEGMMVERREIGLPEGMAGFRGVLVGKILRKLDRGFILKVEKVDRVWESNRADRPEAAVGKELMINVREGEEFGGRFLDILRDLEIGGRVLVEVFHFEGNRLTVVEQLKKIE